MMNEKKTLESDAAPSARKPAGARAPKKTVAAAAKKGAAALAQELPEPTARPESAEQLRDAAVALLQDKKAQGIVSVRVDHLTVVADYFVIASASSTTAVRALAESLDERMSGLGVPPVRKEGLREGKWAALDFGSVIVHVFHSATREIYQLEKLWTDGTNVVEY